MRYFKLETDRMRLAAGLRPCPLHGGAYSDPTDLIAGLKRRGRGREAKGKGGREGREGRKRSSFGIDLGR